MSNLQPNGKPDRNGFHPARVGLGSHERSHFRSLQARVDRGEELTEAEYARNIQRAVFLRDDPNSSDRVVARMVEFLQSVMDKGIDVAMYLDKMDRPAPVAKVEVDQVYTFRVIVE